MIRLLQELSQLQGLLPLISLLQEPISHFKVKGLPLQFYLLEFSNLRDLQPLILAYVQNVSDHLTSHRESRGKCRVVIATVTLVSRLVLDRHLSVMYVTHDVC